EAKEKLEIDGKHVILGPISYVKLSKGYDENNFSKIVQTFVPLYVKVLKQLQEAGATWVQIDEPIFSTNQSPEVVEEAQQVYEILTAAVPHGNIMLQTYF